MSANGGGGSPIDQRCLVIRYIGGHESVIRLVNRATATGAFKRLVEANGDQRIMFDWDVTADESCHLVYPSKIAEVILPPLDTKK